MKIPMQWISEYAPINVDAAAYQDQMIMIGNGVEGYEEVGGEVENVVVGRVLTCEPHPDSDHLHLTTVDVGEAEPLHIVCGAPNCRAGILTPVALVGAKLPGGVKIKKGKVRGQVSEGMLCSSEELGVPVELYPSCGAAGILEFTEDYPVGSDVKPILGIDDTVMDFEVLANRPDCLSVWGIARETAVALGTTFTKPEIAVKECGGDIHDYVQVDVEAADLCPRYIARVIRDVRVGPSPMWLRKYLHGAGMRSINNVVDITNFVMLETGHPMHAFDLDMVEGRRIIVRKAVDGEHITTLDGKEHPLTAGQLAICDARKPSCVAGIMGGEESEITERTHTMMFECAVFDRAATRVTSRALGIRTESSGRFEKGVSVKTAMEAMDRACQLIAELDAGDVVSGCIDIYPEPAGEQVITASCQRIAKRTGVDIPAEDTERILKALHFGVTRDGDAITVTVPDFRQDVDGEADLSEEVLRVYGYGHIPSTLLRGDTTPGGCSERMRLKNRISRVLTGMGYYEIMNFSFVSPKQIDKLGLDEDDSRRSLLAIRNPLGEDTSVMRTTLAPDMLATLALNMNHGIDAVVEAGGDNYLHPGRKAVLKAGDQVVCTLGEVHPDVRERFEMPARAYLAELNLTLLAELVKPMGAVKPLPRYPAVTRDLALVMAEDTQVGPLLRDMAAAAGKILEDARMFDVYRSPLLGADKKSVAFSFTLRGADRTLTEAEVAKAMDKVRRVAEEKYGAVIRG